MAALEQCYAWDEEKYKAWLIDCPATKEQAQALAAIQAEFGLEPMKDAVAYVKQLQAEFDVSKIPYTEDYYDIDMNPAAPKPAPEWKVTFRGDFHSVDQQGTPGIPVQTNKEFRWAGISLRNPFQDPCGWESGEGAASAQRQDQSASHGVLVYAL